MVYKDEILRLAEENIRYTRNGTEYLQPVVEGREWWQEFEEKWPDMDIIGFEDIAYSEEQIQRFEEIKHMDLADTAANDYVMEGIFGGELKELEDKKRLEQVAADIDYLAIMAGVDLNV